MDGKVDDTYNDDEGDEDLLHENFESDDDDNDDEMKMSDEELVCPCMAPKMEEYGPNSLPWDFTVLIQ